MDTRTLGQGLLDAVGAEARERGAVLSIVVCSPKDAPKRDMLREMGYSVASEWYVRDIEGEE